MGYLDSAGLAYLWTKIKGLLSNAGDMKKDRYDPTGKGEDVFAYADALRPRGVSAILSASGWTGNGAPYEQTITIDGLTEHGESGLAEGAAPEQRAAAREAQIEVLGKNLAAGTLTFVADGKKPEVDLPIFVALWE